MDIGIVSMRYAKALMEYAKSLSLIHISSADVVDNIEKVSGIRPAFEELDCLDYAGLDAVFTKYLSLINI